MAKSSKLAILVKKFWEGAPEPIPRSFIGEGLSPQVYLLDYGHSKHGVVMVNYTWEGDSANVEPFTDSAEYLAAVKKSLSRELAGSKFPDFADRLVPAVEGGIVHRHWQLDTTMYGAFAHPHPGQGKNVLSMFYDFEKLRMPGNTDGILIVGDGVSPFQGGWAEGALTTVMNVISAAFEAFGEVYEGKLALLWLPPVMQEVFVHLNV